MTGWTSRETRPLTGSPNANVAKPTPELDQLLNASYSWRCCSTLFRQPLDLAILANIGSGSISPPLSPRNGLGPSHQWRARLGLRAGAWASGVSGSLEARNLIEGAIKKANLTLTAVEFNKLVALACERDETACRELGRVSQLLAPHLPEKRGRPISAETCTHLFLLRLLERSVNKRAYTSSTDNAGFTDLGQRRLQPALCLPAAQREVFAPVA